MQAHTKAPRNRAGFTLLEIAVVLAIIVILAGVLVARLDLFQLKANKGVAASNIAGLSRFIRTFRVQRNQYPDDFDSLVTTGATPGLWTAATATDKGLDPQTTGQPIAGSPTKLTTATLPTGAANVGSLRSLTRMGLQHFLDVDTTAIGGLPGNAFNTRRTLAQGDTYATLNIAGATADGDALDIVRALYGDPAIAATGANSFAARYPSKFLVVVGVGPRNGLVAGGAQGSLLELAPTYSNSANPNLYYDRYLAVFEGDTGGKRARLMGVLGSDGDLLADEIADYVE